MKAILTVSGETLPAILASATEQFDHFFAGASYWYKMAALTARPSARASNYGGVGVVLLWEVDFEAESKPDITPDDG